MKKAISGLLALFLLLSLCAGCGADKAPDQTGAPTQTDAADGEAPSTEAVKPDMSVNIFTKLTGIEPDETVLETDGNAIPAELYFYWLAYACGSLQEQVSMINSYYGMYGELLNEDGTLIWDSELEGKPLKQMVQEQAVSSALSYAVLENVAKAHNISLTDEDKTAMEQDRASYVEQSGGQDAFEQSLWEMGVSAESFDRISATGYLYQHLQELAQDPDSDLYQAPADDDVYVDHILLATKNTETNESLTDEEIEAKRAKAEELLAQLQGADEADLEALFTQLAEENGEDPGRTADAGYLINPDTNFVQEFKDAAFALRPGEISGIVESDYGYHILLRKDLGESQLATLASQHLSSYMDGQLAAAMEALVRSDKLDTIDVGSFYPDYLEMIQALHPDLTAPADDGSGAADGADAGTGADGGDTTPAASGSTDGAAE